MELLQEKLGTKSLDLFLVRLNGNSTRYAGDFNEHLKGSYSVVEMQLSNVTEERLEEMKDNCNIVVLWNDQANNMNFYYGKILTNSIIKEGLNMTLYEAFKPRYYEYKVGNKLFILENMKQITKEEFLLLISLYESYCVQNSLFDFERFLQGQAVFKYLSKR